MTKTEREYLQKVAEIGCIACRKIGFYDTPSEIHHIRAGQGTSQRASHFNVLPLCHAHHRTGGYGVAFHAGKKAFEAKFGTESKLLNDVKTILEN